VIGREQPIERVIDVLCRRRKNNPVLVGEPGVGKTAIVEGLALAIVRGEVPEALRGVELLGLEMGLLEAGASVKGELEARLTAVLREVKASPTPIVLFIDEAHTLVGAQPSGGTDAANLLKPALARGELRTIAATTFREHKKYFEKDPALERRFERVVVEEPSEDAAIAMLRGIVPRYEAAHGVIVRDEAIEAAVRLSHRYVSGRQLPDKCIDLLDTAAARVRVGQAARPLVLATLDARIVSLGAERDRLARDRIDGKATPEAIARVAAALVAAEGQRVEIEARWRAQREALERLLGARRALDAARDAPEAERRAREIDVHAAREALEAARGDAPMVAGEVDAAAVAATLESATGIPVGALKRDRTATLQTLERELGARVLGQPAALASIACGLRIAQAGLRRAEAPLGVFLLVGPSGVGKTETAHALADLLFGGERFLTTVNLSEYQEKHTVSRLVGSPPGYVGYGEGGKLTEAVRQRPHSVVLLDECEKADREVMNLFYQVFDRGSLADGEGRAIDFRSTVLLLTSNLASERIAALAAQGVTDAEAIARDVRPVLSAHFSPALLARMTVVPYLPIADETLRAIADGELARVAERAAHAHGVTLRFGASVHERLVSLCRASDAGVRNLRAVLDRHVLAPLALELLGGAPAPALTVELDAERGLSIVRGAR
jgi:type VI secretion system protein VasG